jgi:hypothetical protein
MGDDQKTQAAVNWTLAIMVLQYCTGRGLEIWDRALKASRACLLSITLQYTKISKARQTPQNDHHHTIFSYAFVERFYARHTFPLHYVYRLRVQICW